MRWTLDPQEQETQTIRRLANFNGRAVVEVGAGDGRLTWRYADHAASVLALDVGEAHISRARARLPQQLQNKVVFQRADITGDYLPKQAFDIALLSWSLC